MTPSKKKEAPEVFANVIYYDTTNMLVYQLYSCTKTKNNAAGCGKAVYCAIMEDQKKGSVDQLPQVHSASDEKGQTCSSHTS